MRCWDVPVVVLLLVAACGPAAIAPVAPPAPDQAPAATVRSAVDPAADLAATILPAGDWYSGHNYMTCWDCPTPTAVVLLDVFGDPAAAERAIAEVPDGVLPLGYPMAWHTDELGLADEPRSGIAVVLGQFETPVQAEAWRERASSAFPQARAVALAQGEEAWAAWDRTPQRRVVRLQAGDPVPAYAPADAEAFLEAVHCREYGGDSDGPCPPFPEAQPLCLLPAGAIFVTTDEEIGGSYYEWLPVRCGGQPAAVAWRYTLFAATVMPRPDGSYFLRQTVGAECDVPTFEEWAYDAHGRRPPEHPAAAPELELPVTVAGIRGASSEGGAQGGCGDS